VGGSRATRTIGPAESAGRTQGRGRIPPVKRRSLPDIRANDGTERFPRRRDNGSNPRRALSGRGKYLERGARSRISLVRLSDVANGEDTSSKAVWTRSEVQYGSTRGHGNHADLRFGQFVKRKLTKTDHVLRVYDWRAAAVKRELRKRPHGAPRYTALRYTRVVAMPPRSLFCNYQSSKQWLRT